MKRDVVGLRQEFLDAQDAVDQLTRQPPSRVQG
jgi:hypothetical protein